MSNNYNPLVIPSEQYLFKPENGQLPLLKKHDDTWFPFTSTHLDHVKYYSEKLNLGRGGKAFGYLAATRPLLSDVLMSPFTALYKLSGRLSKFREYLQSKIKRDSSKPKQPIEDQKYQVNFFNSGELVPTEILTGQLKPTKVNPDGTKEWDIHKSEHSIDYIILDKDGDYQITHTGHLFSVFDS